MAAKTGKPAAKAAHVNMMTDTIITNMPLRDIIVVRCISPVLVVPPGNA